MNFLVRVGQALTFDRLAKGAYAVGVALVGMLVMVILAALMDTSPVHGAVAIGLWFGFMLAVWWGWQRVDEAVG